MLVDRPCWDCWFNAAGGCHDVVSGLLFHCAHLCKLKSSVARFPSTLQVYCAPTSGGKSLVAEVLMVRRLVRSTLDIPQPRRSKPVGGRVVGREQHAVCGRQWPGAFGETPMTRTRNANARTSLGGLPRRALDSPV